MDPSQLAEYSLYENPLWKWAVAIGIAVAAYFLLVLVRLVVVRRLVKLAAHTENKIDDFVTDLLRRQTKTAFLLLFSLLIGAQFLELSETVDHVLSKIILIVVILQGAMWTIGVISFWITSTLERKKNEGDASGVAAFTALRVVAKIIVWVGVVLVVLDNLGINVTTFVAGLGIGGIAVALALQNVLGDLFASISIALDKPFVVGDYVVVGEVNGNVEHIGLKTTRIRSLSGEQIVVSNNDLLNSRIRNFKRMEKRRVNFRIGVIYQTPHEKLVVIPTIVEEVFIAIENADLDRVHFASFGDFALHYEIVYFVAVPDYRTYMDIQQQVNLELYRRFAEAGIEFAYPTQTLYIEKTAGTPAS
jgi:small-conductance mechanosensitive channel